MNPSATARKGLQEVSVTAFGISLVLLALLGTPGACGQPKHFGVKAGATASSLQLEYSPSSGITSGATRTHWGLDAGIFAEWLDGPLVTLMTEVHFVERGTVFKDLIETSPQFPEGTGRRVDSPYLVRYLSVPVSVRLAGGSEGFEGYAMVGPRIDIKLGGGDPSVERLRSLSAGPSIGAGVVSRSLLQRLPVGLEARYDGTIGSEYSNDVVDIHGAWALSILLTVGL